MGRGGPNCFSTGVVISSKTHGSRVRTRMKRTRTTLKRTNTFTCTRPAVGAVTTAPARTRGPVCCVHVGLLILRQPPRPGGRKNLCVGVPTRSFFYIDKEHVSAECRILSETSNSRRREESWELERKKPRSGRSERGATDWFRWSREVTGRENRGRARGFATPGADIHKRQCSSAPDPALSSHPKKQHTKAVAFSFFFVHPPTQA